MIPTLPIRGRLSAGQEIRLDREQTRYLGAVLRLRPGDAAVLLDGAGRRWSARIEKLDRREALLRTTGRLPDGGESPLEIVLGQALLKGAKMDWVVQKATELGVTRIVPLVTERSQPRRQDRCERWRRIAAAAAAQCGRTLVPEISPPADVADFAVPGAEAGVVFWEGSASPLREAIGREGGPVRKVRLLVGPEGGLTADEVRSAREAGWRDATLGPRILRAETGAVIAVALLQFLLGDLAAAAVPPPAQSPSP